MAFSALQGYQCPENKKPRNITFLERKKILANKKT